MRPLPLPTTQQHHDNTFLLLFLLQLLMAAHPYIQLVDQPPEEEVERTEEPAEGQASHKSCCACCTVQRFAALRTTMCCALLCMLCTLPLCAACFREQVLMLAGASCSLLYLQEVAVWGNLAAFLERLDDEWTSSLKASKTSSFGVGFCGGLCLRKGFRGGAECVLLLRSKRSNLSLAP